MAIVTGDRYLELLARFIEQEAGNLLDGTLVLKLNPVGLHYLQTRLEALQELEQLRSGAPVDYLRAYVADLGDHRALEKLRRVLRLLGALQVVAVLRSPARDPTPITLLPFTRLKSLELRGCDLSTSAARGLLQLRPILEKLVCYNSANALRHIFAEPTVEVNVAMKWSRLTAVACPCNGLALMDESLQLLPVVDTMDLSRNNFAKVANLQKCTRLKFLDLGFNHISSVASLSQVVGPITKLVLRNNALVSTQGIETLHSLEALDLSYNIISNFHEVETLGFLPSLQTLWLNGNPISVSSHYREEVFSYFEDASKLEVDGKLMTKLECWLRSRMVSQRAKRRASYGVYAPAKASDVPLHNTRDSSDPLLSQPRQPHKKKAIRVASIDDRTVDSKLAGAVDSVQQDVPETETAPLRSEAKEVDPEVAQLIEQIENMKRDGSSTWLNDLIGFWENEAQSPSNGNKIMGNSDSGRWSQRRKQGKEKTRRRLEDLTVPTGLREAEHVLESVAKFSIEDKPLSSEGIMSSWESREDGNNGLPASPPHYDSDLMHRRQSLVNEMLRLPPDLSATSDSDSDSFDEHLPDSVSDMTNNDSNDSLSVVDKQVIFQELKSKSPEDVGIDVENAVKGSGGGAGTSSPLHSDTSVLETGRNDKGIRGTVGVTEESSSAEPSPSKKYGAEGNPGNVFRKRKQKKTRRIVILEQEKDEELSVDSTSLLRSAEGCQTDMAPQLAAPPPSLARNLSHQFMSSGSSSPNVRRSSSAVAGDRKSVV